MKKKYLLILLLASIFVCNAEDILPPEPSLPDGSIGGHEYVDLGLPSGTLWATCNLGASTPYEAGDDYAWGEVTPRESFTWDNYTWMNGVVENPNTGQKWYDLNDLGNDICGTEYDAARCQWGDSWRLPNAQDRYDLLMRCWSRFTEENGVKGLRVYGPNGNSIFFPAYDFSFYGVQANPILGRFWIGVSEEEFDMDKTPIYPANNAVVMGIELCGLNTYSKIEKSEGMKIRAVINLKESGIDSKIKDNRTVKITYKDGAVVVVGETGSDYKIDIYDLSGAAVYSGNTENGVCRPDILSNGLYLVSLKDESGVVITHKLMIK